MTPSDKSFSSKKRGDGTHHDPPSYEPMAPPPSAPPPSPPPHAALQQPLPSSFSESSRKAQMPRVTNYDSYHDSTTAYNVGGGGGDATIRPNVGEANAADGVGDALPEFLMKLRVTNLIGCGLSILFEIPAFMGHFLFLKWDQAVLGIYLMILVLVLICYEIHTPSIATPLQDYFGLIYHPLGRGLYLLLLGGLCVGQSWIPLMVVGILFWLSAGGTVYAFIKYPRYRRRFQDEHPKDLWMAVSRSARYTWAQPEQEGLLNSVVQAAVTV